MHYDFILYMVYRLDSLFPIKLEPLWWYRDFKRVKVYSKLFYQIWLCTAISKTCQYEYLVEIKNNAVKNDNFLQK